MSQQEALELALEERKNLALDILEQARVLYFQGEEAVIAIDATLWREFVE